MENYKEHKKYNNFLEKLRSYGFPELEKLIGTRFIYSRIGHISTNIFSGTVTSYHLWIYHPNTSKFQVIMTISTDAIDSVSSRKGPIEFTNNVSGRKKGPTRLFVGTPSKLNNDFFQLRKEEIVFLM